MVTSPTPGQPAEREYVTRAIEVVLDPSPSQERWLRSYAGSMRSAYNWAIAEVSENLATRNAERDAGVAEGDLTPALSWSRNSLMAHWRAVRDETHPWHREVSIHAFRTGIENASVALKNFSESRRGKRRGRPVGFRGSRTVTRASRSGSWSWPRVWTITTGSTRALCGTSG